MKALLMVTIRCRKGGRILRSIQIVGPNKVEMRMVQTPKITKPTQVLIQVKAAGICENDMHLIHGTVQMSEYPRVPGREVSGIVKTVGKDVTKVHEGDWVVIEPICYCGRCQACLRGSPNICYNLKETAIHMDGGFQEYMLVDAAQVHKIPSGVTFEEAILTELYATAMHANSRARIRRGDYVLVHGANTVGNIIIQLAKECGAICIVAEPNAEQQKIAKEFGADYCINPLEESLSKKIIEITEGLGPNLIFECTGKPHLIALSMELAANAGVIVSLGMDLKTSTIPFSTIARKELSVVGSRLHAYEFEEAIEKILDRRVYIHRLINQVFPFEDYEEAFDLFMDKKRNTGKIVLKW